VGGGWTTALVGNLLRAPTGCVCGLRRSSGGVDTAFRSDADLRGLGPCSPASARASTPVTKRTPHRWRSLPSSGDVPTLSSATRVLPLAEPGPHKTCASPYNGGSLAKCPTAPGCFPGLLGGLIARIQWTECHACALARLNPCEAVPYLRHAALAAVQAHTLRGDSDRSSRPPRPSLLKFESKSL
jgi:hypothetical protein